MILDDPELRTQIDKSDMLSHIKSLPEYIEKGWALGQSLNISEFNQFKHIVIIGQDIFSDVSNLLKSLLTPVINIPIIILKEFQLPSWLKGEENLLFQMSHLSCSEKEIQFLQQADENNCTILTICPEW